MNKLVFVVVGVLVLVLIAVAGCVEREAVGPAPEEGEEVVTSCSTCHSDKAILKELAVEPEEEEEEAAGEG